MQQLEIASQFFRVLCEGQGHAERFTESIFRRAAIREALLRVCRTSAFKEVYGEEKLIEPEQLYRLTVAIIVSRCFAQPVPSGLKVDLLFLHSLRTAMAAETIGPELGLEPLHLFTAAALHEIGKVELAVAFGTDYVTLIRRRVRRKGLLVERERERFGLDHAVVGGRLLSEAGFPESIARVVACEDDASCAGTVYGSYAAVLAFADLIVRSRRKGAATMVFEMARSAQRFGLDRKRLGALLGEIEVRTENETKWWRMIQPSKMMSP